MDKPESVPVSAELNSHHFNRGHYLVWANGLLGMLLGLLAVIGLWVLPMSPRYFFWPVFLLLLAGIIWPRWRLWIPGSIWKIVPWALLLFFILDIFWGQGIMEALVRMNIFLVVYRCLGLRTVREDFQLLLVCLFLVVITGVFSVSFIFAPQIILFALLGMAFLTNVNDLAVMKDQPSREAAWRAFRWDMFMLRTRERFSWFPIALGAGSFVVMLLVATVIFLVFPRLDLENRFQFLSMRGMGSLSGFSEEVGLNAITDIIQSQGLAMRVDMPEDFRFSSTPYWRMLVLDEYRNGRFRVSDWVSNQQRPLEGRVQTPGGMGWSGVEGLAAPYDQFWTVYLEPGLSRYLPLGGPFREIRMPEESNFRHVQPLQVMAQTFINGSVYIYQLRGMQVGERRIVDREFGDRWENADPEGREYPMTTLNVPVNENSRQYLEELIEMLRDGEEDLAPLDMADRISFYLQNSFGYSLQSRIPGGENDIVVRWLESGEAAHCEYFAAGMILLARTAGIPARMAVGFYGGNVNAYEQHLMVRLSDAHAWVEVFHEGFWHRYDPTPSSDGGPRGGTADQAEGGQIFGEDSGIAAFLDGLRILWYRRIVSFDETDQTNFYLRQRERIQAFADETRQQVTLVLAGIQQWLRGPWDFARIFRMAAILVIVGGTLWLMRRFGWRWRFLFPRSHRTNPYHPFRRRAGLFLRRLYQKKRRRPLPAELITPYREIEDELLQLRFGRDEDWTGSPDKTFRKAQALIKAW